MYRRQQTEVVLLSQKRTLASPKKRVHLNGGRSGSCFYTLTSIQILAWTVYIGSTPHDSYLVVETVRNRADSSN